MIKAMLFDIDGVLMHHKAWFSVSARRERYRDSDAILTEFHEGPLNVECDRGRKDPLVEIGPFLERFGWEGDAAAYFAERYAFERRFIDHAMIRKAGSLRERGLRTYIGSNQNHHRKAFLLEAMNLAEHFDDCFFSCDLGRVKPETEYWEKVLARINAASDPLRPQELLFLDDRMENIASARSFGMEARHIEDPAQVLETIAAFLD